MLLTSFKGPRAEQLKTNFSREYNLRNDGAYNVMDIDACDSGETVFEIPICCSF